MGGLAFAGNGLLHPTVVKTLSSDESDGEEGDSDSEAEQLQTRMTPSEVRKLLEVFKHKAIAAEVETQSIDGRLSRPTSLRTRATFTASSFAAIAQGVKTPTLHSAMHT